MWLVLSHPACKPLASPSRGPGSLSKRLGHVERHLLPHHVITCPGQRVRHGLMGPRHLGLDLLALLIPLHFRIEPPGKVGSFCIGPAHRGMAIFAIALALPLAIAHLGAADTTTIRGVVPHTRKASDIPCFQEDRLGQNRSDPINRLSQVIEGGLVSPAPDPCFHGLDLRSQAVEHRQSAADRQRLIRVR